MEKFIREPRYIPIDHDPFVGPSIERTIPTTEAQQEVLLAAEMSADASCAYIESVSLDLKGVLDRTSLEEAMRGLVARHGALRSAISPNGSRMVVLADLEIATPFVDLAQLGEKERASKLEELSAEDMTTAFNLRSGPLFRCELIRLSADHHLLRLTGHHVVCDGWSLGIMMAEISALYNAARSKTIANLPEAVQFSDYAQATFDFTRSDDHQRIEEFWTQQFAGTVDQIDLPTDRPRPKQKTFNGNRLDLDLSPELVRALRETATRSGASFVTTLLTAFELLLHKLTGSTDIVVGLPAAGQSDLDMKHLVGHCVNLLALRSAIDEDRPFIEHLKQRRTAVLDAFDNQKYTFGTLLRKLNLPRSPGRIPLVPAVFNIDMNMDDGVAFAGLEHRFVSNPRRFENFELFLNATGKDEHLTLEWSYNTDLFDESTVREWMSEFSTLIARIAAKPEARIGDITGTTDLSKAGSLPPVDWYGTAVPYPRNRSVSELFDETVDQFGEQVAVVHGASQLTYDQLQQRVLALAATLAEAGVKPGDFVGLCCDRNFGMVVAQLAILRRGAAFVPLDHTYPAERLKFMLEDTGLTVLLTDPALADALPEHQARIIPLRSDDGPSTTVFRTAPLDRAEGAAYIMYTSGSTGKPKGVVVPHRAIVRLIRDQNYAPFGPDAVITQLSNVSFDASTFELWGALLNGGRLILQPQNKPSLREITDTMEQHKVNILFITTGLFNVLVDEELDRLRGLKCILTGGEAMSIPHITKALRALGPGVLNNIYGPTENTTYSCFHPINEEGDIGRAVPIGKAINNTFLYVLDEDRKPVPVGAKGELYTGGDGVAIGYWQRPELTTERFVPDPFLGGAARMYRTGDLCRWTDKGDIEFLGRTDDQVKIRGFRIELGEIENGISSLAGVRDRVVVVRKDLPGDQQLVAYVVPKDFDPNKDLEARDGMLQALREHLQLSLPKYMQPAFFVLLPSLPLNANGKVDKKQLPLPDLRSTQMRAEHVAPRDDDERNMAVIWGRALGIEDLGVHDNFFDLGGHSIIGIQVLAQVEQEFGRALPLNALFQAPTIALFAELIKAGQPVTTAPLQNLVALQPNGSRIPLFCVHGDEANHYLPKYLSEDQPFYGFFHQGEDGRPIQFTEVTDIAAHFITELKQVRPKGPYNLCGYSFGGLVAFEMACQLVKDGDTVPMLTLLDTYAPKPFAEVMAQEQKFYDPLKKAVMRVMVNVFRAFDRPLPPKLRHFHIIDTYDQATHRFEVLPYGSAVTVIKAVDSPGAGDMGWSEHVRGRLYMQNSSGDHYNMIKEPQVRELAVLVDEALRTAQSVSTIGVV